jgi:hypothetical protein
MSTPQCVKGHENLFDNLPGIAGRIGLQGELMVSTSLPVRGLVAFDLHAIIAVTAQTITHLIST